jgi:hypothetical protein
MNASHEKFPSKVVASFSTHVEAKEAATTLLLTEEVAASQIKIVAPEDQNADRKLQPEARAIESTFFSKHFYYGASGLFAGLALSALAITWGPEAFTASPLLTAITVTWVTFLSSLMLAGAVTLRMDHDLILNHAQRTSDQGMYLVVAHARTTPQKRRFADQLRGRSESVVSTL